MDKKTIIKDSAELLFNSLNSFDDIQRLIDEGEFESQYLECKGPSSPTLDRNLKNKLSEIISGFSNSGGGIIIWGVSTTKNSQSGLDVLTQIQEIGSVKKFEKQIILAIPSLSFPRIEFYKTKSILKNSSDTRGIVITFIAGTSGDPVQAQDGKFYLRTRDEFVEMPYETIKRMFSGVSGPDLEPLFDSRLVKLERDGSWKIPIILTNNSSFVAKDTEISISIINRDSCEKITSRDFTDQSKINPGRTIFMTEVQGPIYRGKNIVVGSMDIKMKKMKFSKRKLNLAVEIFSSNMRAKVYFIKIELAKKGFSIKRVENRFLY